MKRKTQPPQALLAENEDLRARLAKAEAALRSSPPGDREPPAEATERKQLEAELLAAKAQVERRAAEADATLVALVEAVLVYDAEGQIVRANPAAVKALGFDPLHINIAGIARRLSTRLPDGRPLNPADAPAARALRGEAVVGARYSVTNAAGHVATTVSSASPLLIAGRISGAVVTWHDVTELEQTRDDAHRRADELDTIFRAIPAAITLYDRNGRIIRTNRLSEDFVAYTEADKVKPIAERIPQLQVLDIDGKPVKPEDRPAQRALTGETVLGQILCVMRDSKEPMWISSSAAPLYKDGAVAGAVAIVADITQLKQTEEALRESETRFRLALKNAPVSVAAQDRDLRFMWTYNQRTVPVSEIVGKTDVDLFPPEDAARLIALKRTVLETGAEVREKIWVTSGGQRVFWDLLLEPIRDSAGKVTGIGIATIDLTQMKLVENELEAARTQAVNEKNRLEAVMEVLPVGVAILDAQGGSLNSNRMFDDIWGGSRPNPQTVGDYAAYKAWWVDTGQPVQPHEWASARAVQHGETVVGQVMRIERFDGGHAYVLNSAAPILDWHGQIAGCAVAIQDITDRMRAEEALRQARDELEIRVQERTHALADTNAILEKEVGERKQAEELLRQNVRRIEILAEISHDLAAAGSDYGAVLDRVARSTARWIGDACVVRLVSDDGQRLDLAACHHPDPAVLEMVRRILCAGSSGVTEGISGRVFRTQRPLIMSNATVDELRLSAKPTYQPLMDQVGLFSLLTVPLIAEGKALGTLGLFRTAAGCPYTADDLKLLQSIADRAALAITNVRLYRELEETLAEEQTMRRQLIQTEKFAAMGRLMGSVAHELNNPLQTITNCLYLTQRRLVPSAAPQEYLTMATAETERMISLVDQLRELYRARPAGDTELADLADLLQNVQDLTATQLQSQNVRWQSLASLSGCRVNCSRNRLKQVFINIVINAVEAMQPQGGLLSVDARLASDGRCVKVTFKDTGPGVRPEHINNLFEPLFTTKSHGLGLGLAICYEIVQQHGGQITVESQPGEGAAFTVWLPLADPAGFVASEKD